ncbi:MAG: potassium transporter [Erysipelothrix sp.]|nr:potassium transporter [Erysipelothrix sp.]
MFSILRITLVIILAFLMGKFVSKFKLPAILGWLVAGMLLGPHAFNLLNNDILNAPTFKSVQNILECFLGIMIGSELVYSKLKESGKQIFITTLWQSLMTFAFVSLVFGIIFYIMDIPLYLALIFGSIALATAPAPALSIVSEFKANGPVANALIPMAALDDVLAIIVFFTLNSIVVAKNSSSGTSLIFTLFIMIIIPLVIGLPFGYITGKILNANNSKRTSLITIASSVIIMALIAIYINTQLLAAPMLNFMLIGMAYAAVFSNVIEANRLDIVLNRVSPIIYFSLIVVIITLGAPLNYSLIFGAGLFTFIYIVARAIGKYSGARLGAKVTGMPETVQKYLGLTLLPHSGVSLVFTGIAVASLNGFDPASSLIIQSTITAAAVINEIIAVIIAKKAFTWAKEI